MFAVVVCCNFRYVGSCHPYWMLTMNVLITDTLRIISTTIFYCVPLTNRYSMYITIFVLRKWRVQDRGQTFYQLIFSQAECICSGYMSNIQCFFSCSTISNYMIYLLFFSGVHWSISLFEEILNKRTIVDRRFREHASTYSFVNSTTM